MWRMDAGEPRGKEPGERYTTSVILTVLNESGLGYSSGTGDSETWWDYRCVLRALIRFSEGLDERCGGKLGS